MIPLFGFLVLIGSWVLGLLMGEHSCKRSPRVELSNKQSGRAALWASLALLVGVNGLLFVYALSWF